MNFHLCPGRANPLRYVNANTRMKSEKISASEPLEPVRRHHRENQFRHFNAMRLHAHVQMGEHIR